MNYTQTIDYLFSRLPMFQRTGGAAYKANLNNTLKLDEKFGHPHRSFITIHVAGTNGKGSVSSFLASVMMEAGYKTGLYTSPHLVDFRERIRVNGVMMEMDYVVNFVAENKEFIEKNQLSFFELSTALAFKYFADEKVDVAIIETGMGGRLDCTNIINPILSVITNIGFDHMTFLGNTLEKIAQEKAGIIKSGIPVVIGERDAETDFVFEQSAIEKTSELCFAEDICKCQVLEESNVCLQLEVSLGAYNGMKIETTLPGSYQKKNIVTVLAALEKISDKLNFSEKHICDGFRNVKPNTGIRGRWEVLKEDPLVICDTGHNTHGMKEVVSKIKSTPHKNLYVVLGVVNDKEITGILALLPPRAYYIYTKASVPRALSATELFYAGKEAGLTGEVSENVHTAIQKAFHLAEKEDMIFIGGSTFTVADALVDMSIFETKS